MIWRFICTLALSSPGLRSWNTVWNSGAGITNQSRTVYDAANGYRYVTNIAPDNSYSVAITRYGTNVSVTAFDSLNNQLSSINYSYDAHGRPCKFTDARTGTTTNFFNNADQVTGTATPAPSATEASQVTTNYFDVMGRVWKTVLSDGGVVTNDFSLMSQPRTVSGARTYASGNGYDAQGRFKSLTNWSAFPSTGARSTTWNYDPYRGWLTGKSYPDGTGPSYTYTVAGRLNTRLWARGTNATYSYNFAGDLGTTFYSDSTAGVTNKFDRLGRTTSVTNGTSVCNYTFNDLGLMLTETNAAGILSGLSVTNGYDLLLRRTNLSLLSPISQLLSAASYAYDSASRLKTVSSGTNSATYSYLANSPLVSQVFYTNGNTLRMTRSNQFDNLNRLTNLVWNAGGSNVASFAYQYNSANQRTRATLADGSYWLYQYDTLGQVTSSKKYWSDGTPVAGQQTTFDFDDIGNRKSAASGGDSGGANLRSAYYTNNTLNQITGRTVPGYVGVLGSATNIATVTVNNLPTYRRNDYFRAELTATNASSSLWFGVTNLAVLNNGTNADIIASTTGFVYVAQSPETFGYDLDGNLTNSGRWTITWDAENRATSFTRISTASSASKAKVDCTYDYRWRRMQKIVSTWNGSAYVAQSTNKFICDGWNLIGILDATNGLVQSFTWGSDASGSLQGAGGVGGLISLTVHQGTNAGTYFYCFDGNHNVSALVNATNGAIAAQYEFDAFGNPLRVTGALAYVNPFTFSTKFCDWETGFYYYGYRYYDPSAGRWLSRDSINELGFRKLSEVQQRRKIEEEYALYGFVRNVPLSQIDALGNEAEKNCTCGPDVTEWFEAEIVNTMKLLDEVEKKYNHPGELLWIKDHGLEIRHKDMDAQTFGVSGCNSGKKCQRSVSLCNRCIDTSELGNIILGFWVSYLGHTDGELLYGVNWINRKKPGEGANNDADVGGLALGFYYGQQKSKSPAGKTLCDIIAAPYSQTEINAHFTEGKWRNGFSDPWGSMSKPQKDCKPCGKKWNGKHSNPISSDRKP